LRPLDEQWINAKIVSAPFYRLFLRGVANSAGLEARLHVSQDG